MAPHSGTPVPTGKTSADWEQGFMGAGVPAPPLHPVTSLPLVPAVTCRPGFPGSLPAFPLASLRPS